MIIFPAIDIKDNKCVRLTQGDFDKVNIYSEDPYLMAKKWVECGAKFIHVVNLNGSRDEVGINDETLEKIATSVDIPIQVGGGIRDEKRVKELLDLGINRVIVGTMAIENKNLLKELINKYGQEKIVILSIFFNLSASFYTDEKLPRNRGSSPSMFRRSFFVRFPFLPGHRMKSVPCPLMIHCRFEKPIRILSGCRHSASTCYFLGQS